MRKALANAGDIGQLIKRVRHSQGLTQGMLAAASGVGLRFIVDLEKGKPTCELEKALHVLCMLGIQLEATSPEG